MANELKEICDKLAGFDPEKYFEVLAATKTTEGSWELTVKRVNQKANMEVAADADLQRIRAAINPHPGNA